MVFLHGAPPPAPLALAALAAITIAIFVTAAIVSELQRHSGPSTPKRSARSPRDR